MSPNSLTCPSCRATQPARPGLTPGPRAVCAHCGEALTVTLPTGARTGRPGKAGGWAVAATGLAVVVVVGGLALAYSLMTRDFRPKGGPSASGKGRVVPVDLDMVPDNPTPPAKMEGLGYLPTATNLVACAYIRDLRFQVMASNLLMRPVAVGDLKLKLDHVAEWTGLTLREMDHVLLGAVLPGAGGAPQPPLTLVVRTVLEHDQEAVRKAMKATDPAAAAGADGAPRTLYTARLGLLPARLFQPDKHTVVIGLFDEEMKHVPGKPHEGASRLPAEVRDALEKRLPGAPGLWAVGHSADWGQTPVPALIQGRKAAGPLTDHLARVRTVALGTIAWGREGGTLLWQVRAADARAAEELDRTVLQPRLKANPKAFTVTREGEWVRVQLTVDTGPPPGPGTPLWGSGPPPPRGKGEKRPG